MLVNCKDCGKLFNKTLGDICPSCINIRNDAIRKIDRYAFKNSSTSIEEIASNTDIEPDVVRKLILSGKVNSVKSLRAKCEMCGKETNVSTVNFLCRDCVLDIKSVQTEKHEQKKSILKQDQKTHGMRSKKDS